MLRTKERTFCIATADGRRGEERPTVEQLGLSVSVLLQASEHLVSRVRAGQQEPEALRTHKHTGSEGESQLCNIPSL